MHNTNIDIFNIAATINKLEGYVYSFLISNPFKNTIPHLIIPYKVQMKIYNVKIKNNR